MSCEEELLETINGGACVVSQGKGRRALNKARETLRDMSAGPDFIPVSQSSPDYRASPTARHFTRDAVLSGRGKKTLRIKVSRVER
jgi:hypothetical protein